MLECCRVGGIIGHVHSFNIGDPVFLDGAELNAGHGRQPRNFALPPLGGIIRPGRESRPSHLHHRLGEIPAWRLAGGCIIPVVSAADRGGHLDSDTPFLVQTGPPGPGLGVDHQVARRQHNAHRRGNQIRTWVQHDLGENVGHPVQPRLFQIRAIGNMNHRGRTGIVYPHHHAGAQG